MSRFLLTYRSIERVAIRHVLTLSSSQRVSAFGSVHRDLNNRWSTFQHHSGFSTERITEIDSHPEANQTELFTLATAGEAAKAYAILHQLEYASPAAYKACLEAWCNTSGSPENISELVLAAERANEILDEMYQKSTKDNNMLFMPTASQYHDVISAWSKVPQIKGAPQRAQRVLEEMEARFLNEESSARSTVDMYNVLIKIWGQSQEHAKATFATQLLQRMETRSSRSPIQPNKESYCIIISAWCHSGQRRAALTAKDHFMTMTDLFAKSGRFDLEPTLEEYHILFQAMITAKEKSTAIHAYQVMEQMEYLFINRYTQVRPDLNCFKYILQTFANSTLHNLGPKVDTIIKLMTERHITLDTDCYAAAIETWSNDAVHKKCHNCFKSASRTHELLHAMNRAHYRTNVSMVLTTEHYNHVLRAWSSSGRPILPVQNADVLLTGMEASTEIPPDAESYSSVLLTYSRSKSRESLDMARQLMQRAKGRLGNKLKGCVYNSFIIVCAAQKDPNLLMEAFSMAIQTFREARSTGLADADTFYSMLSACNNLIPLGDSRNRALETVFEEGCKLGLLNREILNFFREICTKELYTKVVVAASQEEPQLGGKRLPPSWSSSSDVPWNNTPMGHIVRPITSDGDFLWTKSLMDHRMRHLKQHIGRHLLRGGRHDTVDQSN